MLDVVQKKSNSFKDKAEVAKLDVPSVMGTAEQARTELRTGIDGIATWLATDDFVNRRSVLDQSVAKYKSAWGVLLEYLGHLNSKSNSLKSSDAVTVRHERYLRSKYQSKVVTIPVTLAKSVGYVYSMSGLNKAAHKFFTPELVAPPPETGVSIGTMFDDLPKCVGIVADPVETYWHTELSAMFNLNKEKIEKDIVPQVIAEIEVQKGSHAFVETSMLPRKMVWDLPDAQCKAFDGENFRIHVLATHYGWRSDEVHVLAINRARVRAFPFTQRQITNNMLWGPRDWIWI